MAKITNITSSSIHAEHRLCLTGTPLQNRLSDLHTLLKFLRVPHITEDHVWIEYILKPFINRKPRNLRILLRYIMLRRTKAQHLSHEIPPITHETLMIPMDHRVYSVYEPYYAEFIQLCGVDRGEGTKDPSYYFTMLRRLRMGCNHPLQFDIQKSSSDGPYMPTAMERAVNRRIVPPDPNNPDDHYLDMPASTKKDWVLSTKLQTLIWSIFSRRPAEGAIRKVVVYSQWTSTMTWQVPLPLPLPVRLDKQPYSHCTQ